MTDSNNLLRYVLLEKSLTSTKIIGIYTYQDADIKKEELTSGIMFNIFSLYSYEIKGPYNVKVEEHGDNTQTVSPFILETTSLISDH